jgi:hypothetical protein
MALSIEKLRLLTFPQRIDGKRLDIRLLLLPTQRLLNVQAPFPSHLHPGVVSLPKFIGAGLRVQLKTIRGLSTYPFSDPSVLAAEGASVDTIPTTVQFPGNLPALYEGLSAQFKLDTSAAGTTRGAGAPLADDAGIRKYLPLSYRGAFNFTTPRTAFARTDDSYHCAMKRSPAPSPAFQPTGDAIAWGRVIAMCLRQPMLAERIGLLHRISVTLPADGYFADGGWAYFDLISPLAEFDIANPSVELKKYAARIPPIDGARQLFAALVFPVAPGPAQPNGSFDTLKIEAADYDDGFAKIVHAAQPVSANLLSEEPDGIHVQKDIGIRLGWDDEQLLIWQNRQFLADPATPGQRIDAPLGVFSYRVDVRKKDGPAWRPLVAIRNKSALTLAGKSICPAHTPMETGVEVYPTQINADPGTHFWLPSYFTQWYGASLVLPDGRAAQLDETGSLADPGSYHDSNITAKPDQKGGLYEPLLPRDVELKYGGEYEFRVRLADLAGGGPAAADNEINDAPATSSSIVFQRFVAPKQLKVVPLKPQSNPNSGSVVFYEGDSFEVSRPRLGYPALLFTEMDTNTAFQKLLDDKAFLHTGKTGKELIKEQRTVSYFDPDVDQFMVIVELRSLLLDNLASLSQREAFIPLYTTVRQFPSSPENPFKLQLEYRDAHVIDFGNPVDLGDLNLSQTAIDNGVSIVLPTSRDIRITLLPVCSDKPDNAGYFGFAKAEFSGEFLRTGEPIQFFVRQDAAEETHFFRKDVESRQLQALYLQPDPPQVINAITAVAETVAGKEADQSTVMQRLAAQIGVDFKGMTLIGKPGQRIQFGCGNRIRHTLAPDASSVTFASKGDLINHWLCVLSFEIDRDWTWDGLSETGIEVLRIKQFTGEAATVEHGSLGYIQLKRSASRLTITGPDRSQTRVVFIDAVEPKKDITKASTQANPFPNTIDVEYALVPHFIPAVGAASSVNETVSRGLRLPVTTIPAQVPTVVAAGLALSPYVRNDAYSETAVRQRYLWFELEEPVLDPNDACFARVLTYAPDPLVSYGNFDQLFIRQDDPPLAMDPEPIRVITAEHGNDNVALDAMQAMTPEISDPGQPLIPISPRHYVLPLPPGLHSESGELFGFFTYELRIGHTGRIWSTAQGRYGHPKRVNGVQHPAPPLKCLVNRTADGIAVTADYAVALFNGRNVTSKPPRTEIWCMLYAQVRQADAIQNRNLLLGEIKLQYVDSATPDTAKFLAGRPKLPIRTANSLNVNLDAPLTGIGGWTEKEIGLLLGQFGLSSDVGLSVLAVEMMPRYDQYIVRGPASTQDIHPLSSELGQYRILRTSRLVAASAICCQDCA